MKLRWLIFPALLAAVALLLLLRISLDRSLLFPEDSDVVILTVGLIIGVFSAILFIVKERMDYWQQHSLEQTRRETMAEHRRFMRRLDHELKNPLTALHAGLSTLLLTLSRPDERNLVQTLSAEVQRLSYLVSNLRKLAELETLPLDVSSIDLRQFAEEIKELVQEREDIHSRYFMVEVPPDDGSLPPLAADHDLLLLAVHNLVDNALKYSQPGDKITLRVYSDQNALWIQVTDTGIGIDETEVASVREELYRGQNAREIPGAGIGLSLVEAIIQRHNGLMHIASRAGEGTTVTLSIPYHDVQ